ncbi:MAG: LCP family protein [Clostridia bacterium]|nr:LCP family protein [Clostridia bacterium]
MRNYIRVCGLLLSLALFATALFVGAQEPTDTEPTAGLFQKERVTRILLLGCDRASGLADSILVVSINEDEKCASILQIPRDTYAEYTDRDYKKINGALSTFGESGIKDFFSSALGIPIHHFAVVKLDLFCKMVDAVGGVDIDVPQKMEYHDPAQDLHISLEAGRQHLDGKTAEHFVRYRAGYVNADLGRLDAQKLFLRAFAQRCRDLTPPDYFRLAGASLTGVQTDIGIADAVRLSKILRECDPDTVPMQTLAGQAVKGQSGAWYYVLNREGACRQINELTYPETPINLSDFDADGLFDRVQNPQFHKVYTAAEDALPFVF